MDDQQNTQGNAPQNPQQPIVNPNNINIAPQVNPQQQPTAVNPNPEIAPPQAQPTQPVIGQQVFNVGGADIPDISTKEKNPWLFIGFSVVSTIVGLLTIIFFSFMAVGLAAYAWRISLRNKNKLATITSVVLFAINGIIYVLAVYLVDNG